MPGANVFFLCRWENVRFVIAAVLLFAAGMKAWELATRPNLVLDIFHARWFNALQCQFELFFGLWLLFGFFKKITRLAVVALFVMFVAVSIYKWRSGELSCGCFGTWRVAPWKTALFDFFLLLLVSGTFMERSAAEIFPKRSTMIAFVGIWLLLALPPAALTIRYAPGRLNVDGTITGDAGDILLNPTPWINEAFPLIPYIQGEERNYSEICRSKDCAVILYDRECRHCGELMKIVRSRKDWPLNRVFLLVELKGIQDNGYRRAFAEENWHWGALSRDNRRWHLVVPAVIYLENGAVKNISDDPEKE